jgi:hypothetical protein
MSTDWNVHCIDCNETYTFHDANWCDVDMAVVCKYAAAIAALAPLVSETNQINIELTTSYGRIDPEWFVKHSGHRLVPIREYGHFMTQCPDYVDCTCGSRNRCTKDVGHDGDHAANRNEHHR